jgi:T5SS/PEP-CTERM-associated repeat protein
MAMTFLTLPIQGATKNWIGGHGPWSLAGNWNSGTVPALFDAVNITSSNGLAVTVNYDVSAPTLGVLTVELTGAGTSRTTLFMPANNLTTSGFLLGSSGRGTFDQSGGTITTNHAGLDSVLGHFSSGDGIYNLGGTGALSIARDLYVGNFGTGAFNQTGGTNTISSNLLLAAQSNSFGGYAISGSALSTANEIIVGRAGTGTLNITNGGEVSSTTGLIGALANSDGTATIDGLGSKWTNSGELNVGFSGTGALRITDGGFSSNARGAIAERSESSGSVTVNGVNSRWQSSSIVTVGVSGTGTLSITGGGAVANLTGSLASNSGANGSATVDGPGSTWTNDGDLTVGRAGTGELSITSGGVVSSTNGRIARDAGSRGTVLIDGPGSSWLVDGDITMGQTGTGTAALDVRNGGVVSAAGGMIIGSLGTLVGDGTIATFVFNDGTIAPGPSPGTLLVDGNYSQSFEGTLKIDLASPISFDKLTITGNMTLGGTLDVSLAPGYVPVSGEEFDILDFSNTPDTAFARINLPALSATLAWDTSQLYTTGLLSVTGAPATPGDYSQNGVVDAADYVIWRKGLETIYTQDDYNVWHAHFGQTAGSGATASENAAVPEAATVVLLLVGMVSMCAHRRAMAS